MPLVERLASLGTQKQIVSWVCGLDPCGVYALSWRKNPAGNKLTIMKNKYVEGPKAKENFEKAMKALFRAPKVVKKPKKGKD